MPDTQGGGAPGERDTTRHVADHGGSRIGAYELMAAVARGGKATVYLARRRGHDGFERYVALKLRRGDPARPDGPLQDFLDEIQIVSRLYHSNIAGALDAGFREGTCFLALEFVDGVSARQLVERARLRAQPVPLATALAIGAGIAHGLHHAHEARDGDGAPLAVVHRDVSPSNIMIGRDGVAKLIDFGIASYAGNLARRAGQVIGTAGYMAPEQREGRDPDRRADIFSLAVTIYELTTLTRGFWSGDLAGTSQRIRRGELRRPTEFIPGYPRALEECLLRATAADPGQRPARADLFAAELAAVLDDHGGVAAPHAVAATIAQRFDADRPIWQRLGDEAPPSPDRAGESDWRDLFGAELRIRARAHPARPGAPRSPSRPGDDPITPRRLGRGSAVQPTVTAEPLADDTEVDVRRAPPGWRRVPRRAAALVVALAVLTVALARLIRGRGARDRRSDARGP